MTRSSALLAHLWRLQEEAGVKDAQLARDIGHERSYLCRLRSGKHPPHLTFEFVCKLADRFPELAVHFPQERSYRNSVRDYNTEPTTEGEPRA